MGVLADEWRRAKATQDGNTDRIERHGIEDQFVGHVEYLFLVITHTSRMARNGNIMTVVSPEMSGDQPVLDGSR